MISKSNTNRARSHFPHNFGAYMHVLFIIEVMRDEAKEGGRTEQQHQLDESDFKVQEAKRLMGFKMV